MYHMYRFLTYQLNPYVQKMPMLQDVQPKKTSKAQGSWIQSVDFLFYFRWFSLKAAAKPKAVEKPSSSKASKDEVPKDYVLFVFLC